MHVTGRPYGPLFLPPLLPLPHDDRTARLTLLRKILTDEQAPLRIWVTACLVLLYAQPISRIVRLTIDDIIRDGAEVLLRLGDPPTPVPAPFAVLLLAAASQRQNMSTATNPSSRYLFPRRRAGQPINPYTLYPADARRGSVALGMLVLTPS